MSQIKEAAMNRDRFQDLLDAWGADLSEWPAAGRAAAERLIATDPGAAEALAEARRLDRLIRASLAGASDTDSENAAAGILSRLPDQLPAQEGRAVKPSLRASPLRRGPKPRTFAPALAWTPPRMAALGLAAALGIALGVFWAQQSQDRRTLAASDEGADAAAVIFQTDTAIGTF
jgi:hypothetical protein